MDRRTSRRPKEKDGGSSPKIPQPKPKRDESDRTKAILENPTHARSPHGVFSTAPDVLDVQRNRPF